MGIKQFTTRAVARMAAAVAPSKRAVLCEECGIRIKVDAYSSHIESGPHVVGAFATSQKAVGRTYTRNAHKDDAAVLHGLGLAARGPCSYTKGYWFYPGPRKGETVAEAKRRNNGHTEREWVNGKVNEGWYTPLWYPFLRECMSRKDRAKDFNKICTHPTLQAALTTMLKLGERHTNMLGTTFLNMIRDYHE